MAVLVMRIRRMGVHMAQRFMAVAMAVFTFRRRVMEVFVMRVVVEVRMFVLQCLVLMLVAMRLCQVQHHPGQHQQAAQKHQPAGRAVVQRQRQAGTDEGFAGPTGSFGATRSG